MLIDSLYWVGMNNFECDSIGVPPNILPNLYLGASSGIGAATAVEFAKHGVKLAIHGRNVENLEKTAKKCYEAGLKEAQV